MDPLILPILDQINQIRTQVAGAATLPPASFVDILDTASPVPSYLFPTTGDPVTVERAIYTELDAVMGLQGNLVGVDQLTLPNSYAGQLFPLGLGRWATDDGGIIYWDEATASLKQVTIDPLGGRVLSLEPSGAFPPYGSAIVYHAPIEGNPYLEFHVAPNQNEPTWSRVPQGVVVPSWTVFFSLDAVTVPAARNPTEGHYFVAELNGVSQIFWWSGQSEPAQGLGIFDRGQWGHGFMNSTIPWLVGGNRFIDVTQDDPEPRTFQAFNADGDLGMSTPGSILFKGGTPLVMAGTNWGSTMVIPPPISQEQATMDFAPEAQIFQTVQVSDRLGGKQGRICGTSFVDLNVPIWFIGGQWRPVEGAEVDNYPILLAAKGFRNFHPLTHSAWNNEADGRFLSGFPIVDSAHADQNCTLMVLEKGNGTQVVLEIQMDSNTGVITIPQVTQPTGVKRMFYPGRQLPASQPGGEGSPAC